MSISLSWKNPNSVFEKIVIFRHTAPFETHTEATLVAEITNGAESYVDPVASGDYYYRVGSYVAGTIMLSNMVFKSSSESWSPKSLFINERKGYFFDFRDKSSLLKNFYGESIDSTNEVRVIRDLSGNGNHMQVAARTSKATSIKAISNLKGLSFPETAGFSMYPKYILGSNGKGVYVSAAIKTPSSYGTVGNGYNMGQQLFTSYTTGNTVDFVFGFGGRDLVFYAEPNLSGALTWLAAPALFSTKMVVSAETNPSNGSKVYINNSIVNNSSAYCENLRLDGLCGYNTGSDSAFTSKFGNDGEVYAAVAVLDELTAQEKTNLENWMASLIQ